MGLRPPPQSPITGITPPIWRVRTRSIPITRRLNCSLELIFSIDIKLVRIAINMPVARAATSVIEIISSINVNPLSCGARAAACSVGFSRRPPVLTTITDAHPPPAKLPFEIPPARNYASPRRPSSRFQAQYDRRPKSPAPIQEQFQTAGSRRATNKESPPSAPHRIHQPSEHCAAASAQQAAHPS